MSEADADDPLADRSTDADDPLADRSADDTDAGWGDRRAADNDTPEDEDLARYAEDRPPHWEP